ncbi:hypothetical protein GCM10017691_24360 [Pseudonocardia petroleophila]|uniref:SCP-2 sterol transfer family protein n=1 Tax=Pseudonocardia petroleophila TaxID=37331 RepID=A0A7G7MFR4_9PSEU|nr:hypothetical protein [Pseudonocardia petroleophila]QNG51625.1 hypothetical protein H6H00_26535 [Pseudonocardia petroleophila]
MEINEDRLRDALNADPEFRLQARYWNTQFRIVTESQNLLVRLADGEVTAVDAGATPFDTWDFQLAGTAEHWANLLAPVPPPFFQDYYAAMLYHGFRIEGNMKTIMAYYPAIRRTREVLAQVVARQEVAA